MSARYPFGRTMHHYKDSYDLRGVKIQEKDGFILVECNRCNHSTEQIKDYKIHLDGAISFIFRCTNCDWSFDIYRNSFAEYKQVMRALSK